MTVTQMSWRLLTVAIRFSLSATLNKVAIRKAKAMVATHAKEDRLGPPKVPAASRRMPACVGCITVCVIGVAAFFITEKRKG